MADIQIAPDVESIAVELIGEFHPHLKSHGVRILYLKSEQDRAYRGRPVLADTQALGGLAGWLSQFAPDGDEEPYEYAITVYGSAWQGLTAKERQAAVDAELCKLVEKTVHHRDGETTVIKLQDFDVKGFTANIERFGLWRSSLRIFAAKARQLPLDMNAVAAEEQMARESEASTSADSGEEDDGEGLDLNRPAPVGAGAGRGAE
jgi:hypothetical protein